jgi:hypothetical protein
MVPWALKTLDRWQRQAHSLAGAPSLWLRDYPARNPVPMATWWLHGPKVKRACCVFHSSKPLCQLVPER